MNELTDVAIFIIILQLQAVAYDNTFYLFFQDGRFKAYSTSTRYCTAQCKACTWQRRAYNPPATRLSCLTPCSARNIRGMHASIFITQSECLAQSRQHESTFFVCLFVLEAAPFNRDLLLEVMHSSPPTHCAVRFYFPVPVACSDAFFPSVWFIFNLPLTWLCPPLVRLSV